MKLNLTSSSFLSFFPCTTSSPEACTTGSYHEAGVDVTFVLSSIFAFFRLRVLIQGVLKKRSQRDLVNSHVHLCGCQDPIKSYIDPGYDKS